MEFIPSSDLVQTLLPYLSHGKNDRGCCQQRGQEAFSAGAAPSPARTPGSQDTPGGAWGRREERCLPLSHLNLGTSQKAANPEHHKGHRAAQDAGLCCSPVFLFPRPHGAPGCRRELPRASPPVRGEEGRPEEPAWRAALASWRWQAKEAATILSPSCLKSTAASPRHGFVARDAVLALPASQEARRKGDFCVKKVFPLNPYLLLCWQGLLCYLYRNCPSCAPFSPACPSPLGTYFTGNSDQPPQAYRKHHAKKRKQIMWTELNFPQGVIFLPLLLLDANTSGQIDAEEV